MTDEGLVAKKLARIEGSPPDQVDQLHRMVGLRNVLVHEYDEVDVAVVRAGLEGRTGDLQAFVDTIRVRALRRDGESRGDEEERRLAPIVRRCG